MRALLVALLVTGPAAAHFVPGERTVVVQAEPASVAVLVTYRPPAGVLGALLAADARRAGPSTRGAMVRALLAIRALAPLTLRLDGANLPLDGMQIKLAEDPPGTGRPAVAVLVSARLPSGAHRLEVDVGQAGEPTVTEWLDHAGGRITGFGPRPAGVPLEGRGRLVLDWSP